MSTPRQMNSILPKTSKQAIQLLIEIAVKNHSIDGQAVLALTNLVSNREFILEFKRRQATALAVEKEERVTRAAARLNNMATPKQGLSSNGITPISKCDGAEQSYRVPPDYSDRAPHLSSPVSIVAPPPKSSQVTPPSSPPPPALSTITVVESRGKKKKKSKKATQPKD